MRLKKKHPQDMKVLLATKGREQSDMGKSFVMSEGTQEKNVHVSHDMDECMNLVCKENFDIVIVGLDFSEKKGRPSSSAYELWISISLPRYLLEVI